jgi:HTH-type transcriptional regulator / antitoxin HigA
MHVITRKRLDEFMENLDIKRTIDAWAPLAGTIFVPHTEEEYNRIVALLDELIDEVGENESHPLASMMEILSILIEHYENAHVPELTSQ